MILPIALKRKLRNYLLMQGWRPTLGTPTDVATLNVSFHYDDESLIKEAVALVADYTMISFERAATLWQQVRYLDRYRIGGSVVECGVWKGGAIGLSALAHLSSAAPPQRHLHLFDSFQGLPEPNARLDGDAAVRFVEGRAKGALVTTHKSVGPIDYSRELLDKIGYPQELIHYHVGWFQQTVAPAAEALGDIALLRLDADWYESTAVCIKYLYPLVVKYGVVVIDDYDDYGHFEGCKRAVDEFLALQEQPIFLGHVDYTGRYFVKVN
jgi:hypothetical protein